MADSTCSVAECQSKTRCKGLCNKHYIRMRNHGDPTFRVKPEGRQICTVEGCSKFVDGQGLCGTHYMRNRRTGSPTGSNRKTFKCEIPGCTTSHYARNLCQPHYLRWYTFGDASIRLNHDVVGGKRVCPSCQQDLPLAEFATDRRRSGGRSIYCTPCAVQKSNSWRDANPEKARESKRKWQASNPEAVLEVVHRRRSRKLSAWVEDVSRIVLMERDSWQCGICGGQIEKTSRAPHPLSPSIDHIIPISRGGEHSYANTQAAHLQCNIRKGAKLIAP